MVRFMSFGFCRMNSFGVGYYMTKRLPSQLKLQRHGSPSSPGRAVAVPYYYIARAKPGIQSGVELLGAARTACNGYTVRR